MKKKRKWKTVILAAALLGLAVAGAAFLMNLVTEKGERWEHRTSPRG